MSRALNWFVKPIRYTDILPVRASAYIISIFNEQIGKGAMAYYLHRRHQVPGWEVGSVMLFIMFCEVFYLLFWATVGYAVSDGGLPAAFGLMPWLAAAAVPVFRGLGPLLPRRHPARQYAAGQTVIPRVPQRESPPLRAVSRTAVAGAAGRRDRPTPPR